jgi:16S rRNA (cytosine967-C5)-methyltransferase
VRAFAEALGDRGGEIEALLVADNTPAPVHLCARPGRVDRDELAREVGGEPGALSPYAVHLPGGAPGDLAAVTDGRAHVQDEGSQVVALALADAALDGPDARWLDLCAGPGGKAGLLGALAARRGAHVTAVEVAPHRAALVEQAVRGLPVRVVTADGREIEETGFDRVLVDAPCTGLGALRRRPEARWRRQPSDLPPLTRLQRELLTAAFRAVRPGGLVGYVTCSPHVVETRVTVDEAIRRSAGDIEKLEERQLWPYRDGTDAMFLALLRRAH